MKRYTKDAETPILSLVNIEDGVSNKSDSIANANVQQI
jgi:hypothetical protein